MSYPSIPQYSFYLFTILAIFSLSLKTCTSVPSKLVNVSMAETDPLLPAVATWYGDPAGAGSDGGACGYGNDVRNPPFSAMVSAGNSNLFKGGKGCGACYQVICKENLACSEVPITMTITDECPGTCGDGAPFHFDLSGTAFGALAKPGQADLFRGAGIINIGYKRVSCNYPQTTVTFKIDAGSNPSYFSCVIEFENGDGDLDLVELRPSGSDQWLPMKQSWGANWKIDLVPPQVIAPFSIRLTPLDSKKTLIAENVIPVDWAPGKSYRSLVNF
ncbi:expansin-B4-like [Nicotiana tabacum]|uniref:Expansin-B4-like n=1 Tax=Nicotiana tabacum TaxID=4097 RepID=A0A1S3X2P8_TOBAC|nr:PREDICTED: expansin-B4-like [Nicotiana tabacum]